jgi:hypothetical protein
MGPESTPTCAKTATSQNLSYRICRKGENPWQLRDPAVTEHLPRAEMRALLLSAVAIGNNPKRPSPFLHATRVLRKALSIFGERRQLYSHWLVRWPYSAEDSIDFENIGMRNKWFGEDDSDSSLLQEYRHKCLSYTEKDSEQVYLRRPALENIEWWDEDSKSWHNCLATALSQKWMSFLASDKVGERQASEVLQAASSSSSCEVSPFQAGPTFGTQGSKAYIFRIQAATQLFGAGFKGKNYSV